MFPNKPFCAMSDSAIIYEIGYEEVLQMICPRCGNEVDDTEKSCLSCGYALNGTTKQNRPVRTARSTRRIGGLSKPSFDNRSAPKILTDNKQTKSEPTSDVQQPAAQTPVPSVVETPVTLSTEEPVLPADSVPVDVPTEQTESFTDDQKDILSETTDKRGKRRKKAKSQDKKNKKGEKTKKRRITTGMRIFIWSILFAVLIGGGVGAHFYVRAQFKSWPRMFKVVFGIGETTVYPAVVETITGSDGLPAHRFTISGDNPDVVVVHTLNDQHLTFIDGLATVTIPDSYFIPETVTDDAEAMTVEVSFGILDNRGNETPVPCDPVIINIPQSIVTNLLPAENVVLTYQENITVSMNVLGNSTVTINGEDMTSDVVDGAFSKALPVAMGENTVDIVVTTPYYRAFGHTVAVTRTFPPVSITVGTVPPSRTKDKSVTISGTVEKGASLKLTGSGRLSYSKTKGTFTIKLSMSSLGLYEGTLTATLSDKSDGVYNFRVERIPDATAYQKAATTPELAKLFEDFSDFKGDKLKLSGTVSAMEEDSLTLALGESEYLTFSYYGDTVVAVGDTVIVYGEISSVTDNVPTCYAWFVVR